MHRARLRPNALTTHIPSRQSGRHFAVLLPSSALPPNLPPVPEAPGASFGPSTPAPPRPSQSVHSGLDEYILGRFQRLRSSSSFVPLRKLLSEYRENRERVLDEYLPYEPAPPVGRRVDLEKNEDDGGAVLIAHIIAEPVGQERVIVCSGFPVRSRYGQRSDEGGRTLIVTCTHTIEQVNFISSVDAGGTTLIFTSSGRPIPATSIPSSLPGRDLTLLAIPQQAESYFRPLPVSPYPLPENAEIGVHNSAEEAVLLLRDGTQGWERWIDGKVRRRWGMGHIEGYKDQAWRDATPGTYDHLAHVLFLPLPTGSSSGGPIVSRETGAVVGVVVGDRVEGVKRGQKGWGVPAEAIFEMFSLPGLTLKNKTK
ncbi:hypothetical protein CALVIDRAFT_538905 [Calocera viscosa TUFC12733]|uniref:Trypsin-like serine protease n=1 Tax=Calocera viscosa (strain TUFC12733) TaxID=1330018 RepID=A0A167KAW4_CALVF|nr:hypothetical protein CALVIDRAFT_538905 [Calocera viscosa TUFC12733]